MPLAAGKRLGSYEILSVIGAGGMGEVYRARDTRLDRTVAIKVLPDHVANDPSFKQRFEREAKAISSLNHPHICTLYDIGSEGEVEYLVMELLDGETIAERLATGPLPLSQVLRYGVEIASALDRAHRQGITHRDLKPGNIMLTKAGAKLLDFGLAKLAASPSRAPGSLTTATPDVLTASGTILGTLWYMAPEQLEGKLVDHRADIFAFGSIVYEMATGKRAFAGDTQPSLISAILRDDPQPISALQPLSPPALDALVATCLAKDPDERWQSAGDVGRQLRMLQSASSLSTPQARAAAPALQPQMRRRRWALAFAVLGAAAVSGATVWTLTQPAPQPLPVSRFVITPPAEAPVASTGSYDVAISPDGRRVVYVAAIPGTLNTMLYVRELAELEARAIPGTEAAPGNGGPFFSADGRAVAFAPSLQQLMRVSLDGGPPSRVADLLGGAGLGGAWAADDTVVFSSGNSLLRVSAAGGTSERLTPEIRGLVLAPSLLPGNRGVLFSVAEGGPQRVAVLDLKTREQRTLVDDGDNPVYSPSGHLIFARGTTLMAQPFDLQRLDVTGEAVAVLQGVRRPNGATDFALSANGTLVYVPDTAAAIPSALVWVDRGGNVVGGVDDLPALPNFLRLAPDGQRVVLTRRSETGSASLWIHDLRGRPEMLLTRSSSYGVWSPESTQIALLSNRGDSQFEVITLPADGSVRDPPAVAPGLGADVPAVWTRGGELIVQTRREDIVAVPIDGQGDVRNVRASPDAERDPALSPDERWLAYTSDATGRSEVYIVRYPDGAPTRVSRDGGSDPIWSRSSAELFYRQGDAMMAAAVNGDGETPLVDAPVTLFTGSFQTAPRSYDVGPDGRFLMVQAANAADAGAETASIIVVENWIEEVKRRVPTARP